MTKDFHENNMQTESEFAEQYTKAEAIRFVVIGTLVGALVVIASKAWLFPWFREFVATAPCTTVFGIPGLTVLWNGVFVGIPLHVAILVAAIFGWRGYKILRDDRFPPLKEKVSRPTRIRKGSRARLIGYLHLAACLPPLALAIWGVFQAAGMTEMTRPKAGVCTPNPAAEKVAPQEKQLPAASPERQENANA